MAFQDDYDFYMLKNQAEQLVLHELEVQLEALGEDVCRCNECVVDMAAMALNAAKPIYRFSLLGSLYAAQAMNDEVIAENIQSAVAQAIEKVSTNPSHD